MLASITTPTLVIAGERGFRLEHEQHRVERIRDRRFVEIPDVGHMIHWFRPEALARELITFFDDHPA
jgi:pimeloyl-ACP methyl ester carboxylesterase